MAQARRRLAAWAGPCPVRRPSLEISARASSRASSRSRDPRSPTLPSFLARAHECPRPRRRRARAAPADADPPRFPAPRRLDGRGHEWGDVGTPPRAFRRRARPGRRASGPSAGRSSTRRTPPGTPRRAAPRSRAATTPDGRTTPPPGTPPRDSSSVVSSPTSTPSRTTSARRATAATARTATDDADLDLLGQLPERRSDRRIPPRHPAKSAIRTDPRRARARARSRCVLFGGAPRRGGPRRGVVADGARVVWSSGGVVRAFTAPEPVRQALWCRFPERNSAEDWDVDRSGFDGVGLVSDDASDEPVLCLRHAAAMTTYAPGGASLAVPLPRDVLGDARATTLGLLLPTEGACSPCVTRSTRPSPIVPADADSDPDGSTRNRARPRRRERTPTGRRSRSSRSTRRRSSAFAIPAPNDRIVWSSADSLFVLTHDASLRAHALWRLAPRRTIPTRVRRSAPFDDRRESRRGRDTGRAAGYPGMDTPGLPQKTSKSSPEPENALGAARSPRCSRGERSARVVQGVDRTVAVRGMIADHIGVREP